MGECIELGYFTHLLPLRRRRCDHSSVPVEEDYGAGLPDLQGREELREPFELDNDRDDTGKIEVYDNRRRGDDRRSVAVGEVESMLQPGPSSATARWYQVCAVASKSLGVSSRPRKMMSPSVGV